MDRCYDCNAPLPVDARYDVCKTCIRNQQEAERALRHSQEERESCNERRLFDGCVCEQHLEVR